MQGKQPLFWLLSCSASNGGI